MKSLLATLLAFFSLTALFGQKNINTDTLRKVQTIAEETFADGVLILHKGEIIHEWYNPDCDSVYMGTASAVKSWTGLLVGILLKEGKIKSVEDPVCDYLPEWEAGCKANVKIRHLLTMSAGINKRRATEGPKRVIFVEPDFNKFVLNMPLDTTPGLRFSYSNETVQLFGPIIERTCEMSVEDCFQQKLFEPLGMDSTSLVKDDAGNAIVFGGAETTLRDFAKIGQLMLQKGAWNGQQLVAEDYIEASVTPAPTSAYYGYLWWVNEESGSYSAMGDFGQLCIVFPEKDLIYMRYQTCKNQDRRYNINSWMGLDFLKTLGAVVE